MEDDLERFDHLVQDDGPPLESVKIDMGHQSG